MKRILCTLLCIVLLATTLGTTAVFADGDAVTYQLSECGDDVKLIGRTEVTDTAIIPHTTASGIAFYSNCSGTIEMDVFGKDNYFTKQFFIVYVDGEIYNRVELNHKIKNRTVHATLTIAEDLEPGMHRIEIYRETEEVDAYCEWKSITLNGELIPVPESPYLIEFVGDSITTGYGAYPNSYDTDNQTVNRQAGTKSYAFLTSQALGMDVQVCCTSGYGVEVGYNGLTNLQDMYPYTAYHHNSADSAMWPFERTADVVVINLGTNDIGARLKFGVSESQVLDGIENMMKLVREKNPDCKVVWCTGMMGSAFKSGVIDIVEELGGADEGYYFCELPKGTSGGGGHPSEDEHIAAANVLTEFLLENVLPEDYEDGFVDEDDMESVLSLAKILPGSDYDIGAAEWRSARNDNSDLSGTMTTLYGVINRQVTTGMIVGGSILLVLVVGIVLFAVLYKPKTKAEDTNPEDTTTDPVATKE